MLNKTVLLGRLAQDPQMYTTTSGVLRASFDLAVPVPSKDRNTPPDYIPIVCWKERAEFAHKYLNRGRQIVVEGKIKTRKYTAQDGTNRKAVEIVADNIFFADSGSGGAGNAGNHQNAAALAGAPASAPTGSLAGFTQVDDDDLPF